MITDLRYKYRLLILFAIAFVATMLVFKPILEIAKSKNIVDNPDVRKLQKEPVPVMGGIAVFFGIVVGLCFFKAMITYTVLFPVLGTMTIMLFIGFIDDVLSLKPIWRFLVEIVSAMVMIYGMRCCICNFQGLWGIDTIPTITGVLLSAITFLGIINSVNMIDGIDGLASSFCILIIGSLGVICFLAYQFSFAVLSAVSVGALLPFFLHNVFGRESKMFIGDGGTMMMGAVISSLVFVVLSRRLTFPEVPWLDFSRIAFVIAVMSVPVADTLRVMAVRIYHGTSPFSPDRNHMHHLLTRFEFSSFAITLIEILMDLLAIGTLLLCWALGCGISVQFYVTVAVAAILNWGGAAFLDYHSAHNTRCFALVRSFGRKTHVEDRSGWKKIQKLIDGI